MFTVNQLNKEKRLNDVSFSIQPGKIAIFLGESGAGKSTLLRVLNSLETYDSGSLALDEAPLHPQSIGMVFQHFNLFEHLNAEENILLPLTCCKKMEKKKAMELTANLLEKYGLQDKAKTLIKHLSGGQKQRLAIARTVALNPKIICFDEPTSALDPKLTKQVGDCITELAQENRIVLLTTHDMQLLNHLEGELFLLDKGSIIETSNKTDLAPKLSRFIHG